MNPSTSNIFSRSAFWITCCTLIIAANLYHLWPAYTSLLLKPPAPTTGPGASFVEFKPYLKNTAAAGFLTDKDMSPERNDGSFLQAQYALAPVRLELNDPQQEWLVIDPTHILSAMDLTRDLSVEFIRINPDSKILAQRK